MTNILGGIDYDLLYLDIVKGAITHRHLPKDTSVSLTIPANTPQNTEAYAEVTPPDGYIFCIRYFKLTTPIEVKANIIATCYDDYEVKLLAEDQAENVSDQIYDAGDWDYKFFFLKKFKLYGLVTGYDPTTGTTNLVTTADRTIVLKFSGSLIKIVSV